MLELVGYLRIKLENGLRLSHKMTGARFKLENGLVLGLSLKLAGSETKSYFTHHVF